MKSGPIIIIEDDNDDKVIMKEILKELQVENKEIWFTNSKDAMTYLCSTSESPFLILCDINLPGKNGIEFKRSVDSDLYLRKKSVPFIFYSTTADVNSVTEAYTQMTVQGFFQKKDKYEDIKHDIKIIIDYWKACRHPNS